MNQETLNTKNEPTYPVKIDFDSIDNLYTAEFFDLPGCSAVGSTVEEAYASAQQAKEDWLRVTAEQGLPVPKPSRTDASGRILLRLPSSLHGMLADKARLNGSSLNQYLVHLLSAGLVSDDIAGRVAELTTQIESLRFTRWNDLFRPTSRQNSPTGYIATNMPNWFNEPSQSNPQPLTQ